MQKKYPKTLIEKMGFKDTELTTPEHDEMFLHFLDKKNCFNMIKKLALLEKQTISRYCNFLCENNCDWDWKLVKCKNKENSEKLAKEYFKLKENTNTYYDLKIFAEKPIISGYYTVGFIDLLLQLKLPETEHFSVKTKDGYHEISFIVEIKPQIKSIGETIRQIKYYQKYEKGIPIIITKTKGLAEIFKGQGIYIFEYGCNLKDFE